MLQSLKFSSGRSLHLLVLLLVLILTLSSCSKLPLSLLGGGGPNVAANTQLGKTNTQTVGTTKSNTVTESTVETVDQSTNEVKTEKVETVNIQQTPFWMILLLILGWLLPSPGEIGRGFMRLIRRDA
jgi:hypothetical protein